MSFFLLAADISKVYVLKKNQIAADISAAEASLRKKKSSSGAGSFLLKKFKASRFYS